MFGGAEALPSAADRRAGLDIAASSIALQVRFHDESLQWPCRGSGNGNDYLVVSC